MIDIYIDHKLQNRLSYAMKKQKIDDCGLRNKRTTKDI